MTGPSQSSALDAELLRRHLLERLGDDFGLTDEQLAAYAAQGRAEGEPIGIYWMNAATHRIKIAMRPEDYA